MRTFLIKCMEGNLFYDFFAQKDNELSALVESIFNDYFAEAFAQSEDPHQIVKMTRRAVIDDKCKDDEGMQEMINTEIESMLSPEASETAMISDV